VPASIEILVIGAGPAGLRAAEVLAAAGREVLVLERNEVIGPKVCAGGLTPKAQALVEELGLPPDEGLTSIGHASLAGSGPFVIDAARCRIRTVPRYTLGQHQAERARQAGALVRTGITASHIDLATRTVQAAGDTIRYRTLIGADGSESRVRRALGVPSPRAYFACEYNVPRARLEPLRVECDPVELAAGYFWVFPHAGYTSIGCGAPKHQVAPRELHRILDRRMQELGVAPCSAQFAGATIEVQYAGIAFPGDVFLVGDAAGLPSPLTAEGIYPALVSGEEVARQILDPGYAMPALARWLKVKRQHDRLSGMLTSLALRQALLPVFAGLRHLTIARRALADFYLAG